MQKKISATLLAFGALMGGCGGGAPADAPKLAPTSGVVKYKGRTMPNLVVNFHAEKGPMGVGATDKDGKFQIKTNGALGAVVGKHKVTLASSGGGTNEILPEANGHEMEFEKKKQASIPAKYANPSTTDLLIEIPEAGNEQLTLDAT
jgi:hypothetical protein